MKKLGVLFFTFACLASFVNSMSLAASKPKPVNPIKFDDNAIKLPPTWKKHKPAVHQPQRFVKPSKPKVGSKRKLAL